MCWLIYCDPLVIRGRHYATKRGKKHKSVCLLGSYNARYLDTEVAPFGSSIYFLSQAYSS
jgi:hypothetical protein